MEKNEFIYSSSFQNFTSYFFVGFSTPYFKAKVASLNLKQKLNFFVDQQKKITNISFLSLYVSLISFFMQSLDLKGKVESIKEKLNIHKKEPNYYNSFFLLPRKKIWKEKVDLMYFWTPIQKSIFFGKKQISKIGPITYGKKKYIKKLRNLYSLIFSKYSQISNIKLKKLKANFRLKKK